MDPGSAQRLGVGLGLLGSPHKWTHVLPGWGARDLQTILKQRNRAKALLHHTRPHILGQRQEERGLESDLEKVGLTLSPAELLPTVPTVVPHRPLPSVHGPPPGSQCTWPITILPVYTAHHHPPSVHGA